MQALHKDIAHHSKMVNTIISTELHYCNEDFPVLIFIAFFSTKPFPERI